MTDYDPDFEQLRLTMLARQNPEIVKTQGKVVFFAEDDEDHISWSRWFLQDEKVSALCSETGFTTDLMNLLDIFIQYRAQCHQLPRKTGVVLFSEDKWRIEWHTKASAEVLIDANQPQGA